MPFKEDLATGQYWEDKVARTLSRLGWFFRISDTRDSDILAQVPKTLEVKTDFRAEQTGNIYIETFNSKQGKESGLDTSTADLWVYCIPHLMTLFLFARVDMKTYIGDNLGDLRQVPGGDENSVGYLLPIIELEKLDFVTKIVM
jgi:hypothetical protein